MAKGSSLQCLCQDTHGLAHLGVARVPVAGHRSEHVRGGLEKCVWGVWCVCVCGPATLRARLGMASLSVGTPRASFPPLVALCFVLFLLLLWWPHCYPGLPLPLASHVVAVQPFRSHVPSLFLLLCPCCLPLFHHLSLVRLALLRWVLLLCPSTVPWPQERRSYVNHCTASG